MEIELGKFVSVIYDLYSADSEKEGNPEIMEQATVEHPFAFIYGYQQVLDAFEKELVGKSQGDSFDFSLTPDQAYGDYEDGLVVDVPRETFVIDGKFDEKMVYVNAVLPMHDAEGNHMYGSVVSINDQFVKMDFNHPFAGETLHFVGKIVEVRDATEEELNPPTHGCSCCGSDCGDDSCGCGEGGCNGCH